MTDHPTDIARAMSDLIEDERQALINADFDRLEGLTEAKQKMAETLSRVSLSPKVVATLRDGLRRNSELYQHTLDGIRRVTDRMTALNRLRTGMDTYGADGRKTSVGAEIASQFERRA